MKTKILFYLIISFTILSCSENDNTDLDSSQSVSQKVMNASNELEATTYWPNYEGSSWALFIDGMRCGDICMGHGICAASNVIVIGMGFYQTTGKPVKVKIKQGLLNVQALDHAVLLTDVQQGINDFGSDMDAQELYNSIRSTVKIEGTLIIDAELTEALIPNSNGQELVIIPGEYPVDYSNSEFGEFNLAFEMN